MFKLKDAKTYYESLGDDIVKGKSENFKNDNKSLWFNVGYWKGVTSYEEACKNYADKLVEFGGINKDDTILDVGFGFGVQDIHWMKKYNPKKIIGLNISPTQVKVGRELVEEEGLSEKIDFRVGDAVNLDFEDNSFDMLIALDCIYHFNTREKFIKEAYRVLKPNGKLVFSDFLPSKRRNNFFRKFLLNTHSIPIKNLYPKEELLEISSSIGFKNIQNIDISDGVFQGTSKYVLQRMKGKNSSDIEVVLDPKDEKKYRRNYNIVGMNTCYIFSMQKVI